MTFFGFLNKGKTRRALYKGRAKHCQPQEVQSRGTIHQPLKGNQHSIRGHANETMTPDQPLKGGGPKTPEGSNLVTVLVRLTILTSILDSTWFLQIHSRHYTITCTFFTSS